MLPVRDSVLLVNKQAGKDMLCHGSTEPHIRSIPAQRHALPVQTQTLRRDQLGCPGPALPPTLSFWQRPAGIVQGASLAAGREVSSLAGQSTILVLTRCSKACFFT